MQQSYDKHKRDKELDRFYHSSDWKRCRELALIRDNYLCQDCLSNKRIRKADMVHHIIEVKDDMQFALTIENLRSLCNPCHNQQHSIHSNKLNKLSDKITVIRAAENEERW
ncbi:HNH endonuclease [Solibacillus cecembensis]|uniref:HNH endonuclease n=1 Tax=Solibacillus cecembensis TaxID=459347 RepID=UPI003CFF6E57